MKDFPIKSKASTDNTTVYVGNLAPDTIQNDLAIPFQQYGTIEEIRVLSERGYGFVKFQEHESAIRAIVGMDQEQIGVRKVKWKKYPIPQPITTYSYQPSYPTPQYGPNPFIPYQPQQQGQYPAIYAPNQHYQYQYPNTNQYPYNPGY